MPPVVSKTWSGTSLEAAVGLTQATHSEHASQGEEEMKQELAESSLNWPPKMCLRSELRAWLEEHQTVVPQEDRPVAAPLRETFCAEVEVLRQEMQSSELVIEGEFLSHDQMVQKGTALAKRMKKMQDLAEKFSAPKAQDLTEIQTRFLGSNKLKLKWLESKSHGQNTLNLLRLKTSIDKSIHEMEAVHKEMSDDFSNGVVAGYSKKLLVLNE
eukprot:s166_g28.t1